VKQLVNGTARNQPQGVRKYIQAQRLIAEWFSFDDGRLTRCYGVEARKLYRFLTRSGFIWDASRAVWRLRRGITSPKWSKFE
jgi:hypothetical protein